MATASLGFNFVALRRSIFSGMCAYETRCSSVLCSDLFREMRHLTVTFLEEEGGEKCGERGSASFIVHFFLAVHPRS